MAFPTFPGLGKFGEGPLGSHIWDPKSGSQLAQNFGPQAWPKFGLTFPGTQKMGPLFWVPHVTLWVQHFYNLIPGLRACVLLEAELQGRQGSNELAIEGRAFHQFDLLGIAEGSVGDMLLMESIKGHPGPQGPKPTPNLDLGSKFASPWTSSPHVFVHGSSHCAQVCPPCSFHWGLVARSICCKFLCERVVSIISILAGALRCFPTRAQV